MKLNERGALLDTRELQEIKKKVEARLPKTKWLMICGSIQPGVPPHYYCEIIEMAKHHGVKTLLDTDGAAIQHALEAKPTVIMQNQHEAERLLSRALITRGQCLEALDVMQGMGPESVILSLGARGAIGSSPEGVFEALPPRIEALCPIGAGDALVAAFAWSMEKKNCIFRSAALGRGYRHRGRQAPRHGVPNFCRLPRSLQASGITQGTLTAAHFRYAGATGSAARAYYPFLRRLKNTLEAFPEVAISSTNSNSSDTIVDTEPMIK